MVLTSRLRGLSKFHVSNHFLGLSTRHLEGMIDTISCMQFVAHQILNICSVELTQFRAFSVWLRQEIDVQASENQTQENVDFTAKVDHERTLQYVRGPMLHSRLKGYLGLDEVKSMAEDVDLNADIGVLFDKYKASVNENSTTIQSRKLPHLAALLKITDQQCDQLLSGIADVQRKGLRFGTPIHLLDTTSRLVDTRMIAKVISSSVMPTMILTKVG